MLGTSNLAFEKREKGGLFLSLWKQDEMIISKKYGPFGANLLILIERSQIEKPC